MTDERTGGPADQVDLGGTEFLSRDWDAESARLAARAIQAGQPTAWFETLYAGGRRGEIDMPWDRAEPLSLLRDWLPRADTATSPTAVVVGCGLGVDAQFVASRGYRTTAFDISDTVAVLPRRDRILRPSRPTPGPHRAPRSHHATTTMASRVHPPLPARAGCPPRS
jgi:hypothetical protein